MASSPTHRQDNMTTQKQNTDSHNLLHKIGRAEKLRHGRRIRVSTHDRHGEHAGLPAQPPLILPGTPRLPRSLQLSGHGFEHSLQGKRVTKASTVHKRYRSVCAGTHVMRRSAGEARRRSAEQCARGEEAAVCARTPTIHGAD